jgi:hypothetical protein
MGDSHTIVISKRALPGEELAITDRDQKTVIARVALLCSSSLDIERSKRDSVLQLPLESGEGDRIGVRRSKETMPMSSGQGPCDAGNQRSMAKKSKPDR